MHPAHNLDPWRIQITEKHKINKNFNKTNNISFADKLLSDMKTICRVFSDLEKLQKSIAYI